MSLSNDKAALFGTKSKSTTSSSAPATALSTSVPQTTKKTATVTSANVNKISSIQLNPEKKAQKIAEAEKLCEKALGYLKTSVFSWTPDYLAAAPNFEQAGAAFQTANEMDKAVSMYLKASEAHEKSGALGSAALALIKGSSVTKLQGDHMHTAKLLKKAAEMFGVYGDLDRYAETLVKAGKEVEEIKPDESAELYNKAIDTLYPSSNSIEQLSKLNPAILDIIRTVFTFFIKQNKLKDALILSDKMIKIFTAFDSESSLCKSMLSVTILQLTLGDFVLAQETYLQNHLNNPLYIRSKECEVADLLITAYSNQDLDLLDQAKMHVQLNYLDLEVKLLAKKLSFLNNLEDFEESAVVGKVVDVNKSDEVMKSALFGVKKKAPTVNPVPDTSDELDKVVIEDENEDEAMKKIDDHEEEVEDDKVENEVENEDEDDDDDEVDLS